MNDNLEGFVLKWTSYTCNDSLRKEKKKKVMAQDRKSKRQTEKQDSSRGFRLSTSNGTHDMYIYACVIFSGWINIFSNKIYCVSVPDENQPTQSPSGVLPVL